MDSKKFDMIMNYQLKKLKGGKEKLARHKTESEEDNEDKETEEEDEDDEDEEDIPKKKYEEENEDDEDEKHETKEEETKTKTNEKTMIVEREINLSLINEKINIIMGLLQQLHNSNK
jgi:ABC-type Zn2+ transport system substrate-binding protein/surface adhesin